MRRLRFPVAALAVAALCTTALYAQKTTELKPGGGGSAHVRTEYVIDGANVSIEYGTAVAEGPHGRQGSGALRRGMADRRRRRRRRSSSTRR